ncbi:helix-turn-helix domain-containing protein [Shewanella sp.]|uniref:helix-turn-helix domain-containing protein n=1 Tax=Shewanella sp. TaxID=50422 RepID=UPI0035627D7D
MMTSATHKVLILVPPQVSLFELGCATELFALPRPEFSHWYQTRLMRWHESASHEAKALTEPLPASGGLGLVAPIGDSFDGVDTLVVPSWPIEVTPPASLLYAIRRFFEGGGRLISFCSGAFLLAGAGVLDGKAACTHWRYGAAFRERFANVTVQDEVLYSFDGRIGCSAGSAAAIDLGLALIRHDFGSEMANQVARRLVLSPHRSGGQAQFVQTPVPRRPDAFSATLDWALSRLDEVISVEQLAAKSHMSRRSFDRRFRLATGTSPKLWLLQHRLDSAKRLLEETNLGLDAVAAQAGLGQALNLRLHFQKQLGITPSQYRQQFGLTR